MTALTPIIEALVDAGATPQQILAAVRAHEKAATDALAHRRAVDAARQQRYRDRNATLRDVTVTVPSREGVRAETTTLTLPVPIPKNKGESADALLAPLKAVLNEEAAKAVIEHRKRLKKPLTPRAAKMLAEKLGAFPDPNAAADEMMLRGWSSIDATWDSLRPKTGPPGTTSAPTELPKWQGPNGDGSRQNRKPENPPVLPGRADVHPGDEGGPEGRSVLHDQAGDSGVDSVGGIPRGPLRLVAGSDAPGREAAAGFVHGPSPVAGVVRRVLPSSGEAVLPFDGPSRAYS